MLRVLKTIAIVSVCLATAPGLAAAEPDLDDPGTALERSQAAVAEARRMRRDTNFNPTAHQRGDPAVTAAEQASRSDSTSYSAAEFPEVDRDSMAKAQADIRSLLVDPRLQDASGPSTDGASPPPLIFVSLSLPEDSLRGLLAEAATTGSSPVLRGLVENSMKHTAARLSDLFELCWP